MQIKDLEDIVQERLVIYNIFILPILNNYEININFRDDLRSVAMTLRQLSKYLCSFLITKQEELNNSIVERMNGMKCGGIHNGKGDGDFCPTEAISTHENTENETSPRRVHFVPNIEEIVSLIDENSVLADFTNTEITNEETNHVELNECLQKLNKEAAVLSGIFFIIIVIKNVLFSIYVFFFFLDVINSEHKLLCLNSGDICNKLLFDKKLEHYQHVSYFLFRIFLLK